MREILFRGKRKDNGEWIDGSLVIRGKQNFLFTGETKTFGYMINWVWYEVDPETVCQYTGLADKNGNKIFEGDIVRKFLCIDDHNEPLYEYGKVVYIPERISFEIWDNDNNQITTTAGLEVIGNIFDNPELIGE